ncbi:hypothetical protein EPUS_03678 [Endocarpon pusillum Z07020]|uniref:Uncharacterized protein n=1 Tax=Endocarpon pusillum (strain Z07020 / HMAS-L-300199) TaxID=1263415 RepID=U1GDB7_ENDPU|nr:uncharacterized protein EPUS_03678 [Endocarpon pusillum Z07020]ERF69686.1 hypothetical protein EPUS_03678 [Endocarpon pusillum Z07020]
MADPTSPSLISMRELDPSPVASPLSPQSPSSPSVEKANAEDSSFPYFNDNPPHPPKPTSASTSTTLGLHPHTLTRTLLALQKYSTYPFALFLTFHITNTSLLPLVTRNLHTADTYLLLTRPYYQSQLLEPALLLAPLAQRTSSPAYPPPPPRHQTPRRRIPRRAPQGALAETLGSVCIGLSICPAGGGAQFRE